MTADSSIVNALVASLVALAAGACSSADGGTDQGTVYFTPLERQETVTEPVEAPAPPIDLENRPSYRKIIEGFRKSATTLFKRDGIEQRLDQIERVFVGTGKYLELVSIYQDVYEKLGIESSVADRLAWAYIRLGQRQQARALLDEMTEARPEDPTVAFLDGFYWMNAGQDSQKALARAALQWQRVLKLEPNFDAFGRVNARSLKAQIRRIEGQLPKPPAQMVDARDPEGESEQAEGKRQRAKGKGKPEEREQVARRDEQKTGGGGESSEETAKAPAKEKAPAKRAGETDREQGPPPIGVVMMRADEAFSTGKLRKAKRRYEKILERDPEHAGAQIGLVKVAWKENPEDSGLAGRVRTLADTDDLAARDVYELGLFAKVRLKNQTLADEIFQRVREMSPDFADKVGIE